MNIHYCTHKKHHSQKKINAIKAEAVLKLDRKERINFDIKSNKYRSKNSKKKNIKVPALPKGTGYLSYPQVK
jgi:hypothetical protein